MFENLSFIDPNFKIKRKYNIHYKALKNFVKNESPYKLEEEKILSKFFERYVCNDESNRLERRTLLLNMMGSLRVLFFTAPYEMVIEDLQKIGLNLKIDNKHKTMINGEFVRKSKNHKYMDFDKYINRKEKRNPVIVEVRKKSKFIKREIN